MWQRIQTLYIGIATALTAAMFFCRMATIIGPEGNNIDIRYYENLDEFFEKNEGCNFYLFTKKAKSSYADINYPDDVYFFFGRESCGLPEELLNKYPNRCLRIPMKGGLRSLNQSNSCAIAVYEYLRQKNFESLV